MAEQKKPDFDSIKQTNVYGEGYWSARDLMPLLGYGKNWRNFETALNKAMIACEEAGQATKNHFDASVKMVSIGSGSERELSDYQLSRLACYLIAMNGNPRKPEIAAAQTYFAVSTRAHEMHQLRREQEERLAVRIKVSESYRALGEAAILSGVNSEFFKIYPPLPASARWSRSAVARWRNGGKIHPLTSNASYLGLRKNLSYNMKRKIPRVREALSHG